MGYIGGDTLFALGKKHLEYEYAVFVRTGVRRQNTEREQGDGASRIGGC
jgi:hypothetical protein